MSITKPTLDETKQTLAEIADYFGLDYLVILRNSEQLLNMLDDIIESRREQWQCPMCLSPLNYQHIGQKRYSNYRVICSLCDYEEIIPDPRDI